MKTTPDEFKGIILKDQELGNEFNSDPRKYGNIDIDEDEQRLLSLPPKFGVLKKVDVVDTKIEVEKCLTGMRWKQNNVDCEQDHEETMLYDEGKKEMDINRIKPTSLPFNDKTYMPKPLTLEKEIAFQKFKADVQEIAEDMNKKTKNNANLNEDEKRGLKKLLERRKSAEIVCFQTDKSGRWAVDSLDNYREATLKHLQSGVSEISSAEYEQRETELNCHTKALLRMMGLRDNFNGKRLQQACTAEGINFVELYSLRKDHKPMVVGEEITGPKTRPVCGCRDCGTKRISYLLCQVLRPMVSESKTHCESTEDLISAIEELNNGETPVDKNWIVGSLDIEALYPSLDVAICAEIAGNELYASAIQFNNLQWKEIVLYLRFMLSDDEICDKGLEKYSPQRQSRRGRPPLFTASGSC